MGSQGNLPYMYCFNLKKKKESAFYLLKDQVLCVTAQNLKFLLRGSISCSPFKMGGKNKNILPVTEYERNSHP